MTMNAKIVGRPRMRIQNSKEGKLHIMCSQFPDA
jgi:hypothetical protein